ncbi:TPA: glycosyltransferase, partial [Streptococcus suis]
MRKINIAFSINDNHCPYVFFTISVIKKYSDNLNIYVLHTDLSDKSKDTLKTLESERVSIHFVTINKDLFVDLPLTLAGITIETYYRYLLPEILVDCDKVIYLDSDLLIRCDVKELWDIDVSQHYLAGVNEIDIINRFTDHKLKLGFEIDELFINAGVLVCNLQKMRRDKIAQHLFQETERLKGISRFQDQDVINVALQGKIAELPLAYNYTMEAMEKELLSLDEIKIIHYNSPGAKPWNLENYNNDKIVTFLREWQQEFITIMQEHQQIEVSLLLSYYGEENQLKELLKKTCNQTYKNIEIIIVDYSIEGTINKGKIQAKLAIEENKIKIIKVRNGLDIQEEIKKQVVGKYLVNINHIDGMYNEFIEKAVETGEKNNSDIVLIENCILDENNGNYYFFG